MKYIHIIKPGIKNIYIKVDKEGNVILTSSSHNKKEAIRLIERKKEWIQKAKDRVKSSPKKENIYKDGGWIYLFGKKFPFIFVLGSKDSIIVKDEAIYFYSKNHLNPQKAVERFYKDELEKYINQKVKFYTQKLSLYPKEIKFRKMKRRLGSCSYDDRLTFNTLLAKLSFLEIDYVIVHELSHIKHKNHSRKFWAEVSKIFPNYKEIRKNITL